MSAFGAPESVSLPQTGDIIDGKYVLDALIGKGGMGAVYQARHMKLGHKVAIKVMLADAANQEAAHRFVNEGRAAANIQNEHVVRVSDVDEEHGYAYMVLELLEGEDLAQVLDREKRLAPHVAVGYVLQALDGVKQAHAQGIVHRDLKPSNLFLARRGDSGVVVKVLDFGISKANQSSLGQTPGALTSTKAMLGSPLYMSPEQLRSSKNVDARADIWAMGIIMFELITGSLPFMGENLGELFAAILENDAPLLRLRAPDVSAGLEAVVARCLQRKPENRFQSVADLERELVVFSSAMAAMGSGAAIMNPGQPSTVAMMMSPMAGYSASASSASQDRSGSGGYGAPIPPNTPQHLSPNLMSPPPGTALPGQVGQVTPSGHLGAPNAKGTVPLGASTPQPYAQSAQAGLHPQAQPQQYTTGSAWQSTGSSNKGSNTTLMLVLGFATLALVGVGFVGYSTLKRHDGSAGGTGPTTSSSTTSAPSSPGSTGGVSPSGSTAGAATAPSASQAAATTASVASASSSPPSVPPNGAQIGGGTGPRHTTTRNEPKVLPPVAVPPPPTAVADPPRPPPAKPPAPAPPPPALTGGTPVQTR